jgi:translation initiation factor eIF-2B subunit alpha
MSSALIHSGDMQRPQDSIIGADDAFSGTEKDGQCKPRFLIDENHPTIDYTPPSYITLLFTDVGVLTPSAVSDELIKMYC